MRKKLSKRQAGKQLNEEGRFRRSRCSSVAWSITTRRRVLRLRSGIWVTREDWRVPQAGAGGRGSVGSLPASAAAGDGLTHGTASDLGEVVERDRGRRSRTTAPGIEATTKSGNQTLKSKPVVRFDAKQFGDPAWRLNNLYWIIKDGKRVRFQFNWAQEQLYRKSTITISS